MFVDGLLVPVKLQVKLLVNGISIIQAPVDTVTYYHIELPHHGILFAEGLECESYLDTGNRTVFANGGAALPLHPDFTSPVWEAAGCAPLLAMGPRLEGVRQRLAGIADIMAHIAETAD